MPRVRLIAAGDLHHMASNRDSLLCARALELWRLLEAQVASQNPDALLQLGDLIDGYQLPIDVCRRDLEAVQAVFDKSPVPVHALIGNHETVYLPDRPFMLRTLHWEDFSRVVEIGPLRVVLFDLTVDGESYGLLTPERAAWLEAAVTRAPQKPVLLLQHPLVHPKESVCEHRHYVQNSGAYRELLARLPQIVMLLTGHRHIPDLLEIPGTKPSTPAPGQRIGVLPQITLAAFCSYPLTFAELHADAEARTLTFRELPLEPQPAHPISKELPALLREVLETKVQELPEVWRGRERMTPALREVKVRWA